MNNSPISRPFPIFRTIAIGVMIMVSRILKWVIPVLLVFICFAWTPYIADNLSNGEVIRTVDGRVLTLAALLISIGRMFLYAAISFTIGELLIRLNEHLARSTAEHMGKDIDKM